MPTMIMLCGVPASGKSTWVDDVLRRDIWTAHRVCVPLSTDNTILQIADAYLFTYDEAFKSLISFAELVLYKRLDDAINCNYDIIWDQTNLTPSAREKKLAKIPSTYRKVAVNFPVPDAQQLAERLASRPGKNIPADVMSRMIESYIPATRAEGFDEVRNYDDSIIYKELLGVTV